MKNIKIILSLLLGLQVILVTPFVVAQEEDVLSEEELKKAYEAAAEQYREETSKLPVYDVSEPEEEEAQKQVIPEEAAPYESSQPADVALISEKALEFYRKHGPTGYSPLSEIRVAIDVENSSLKDLVNRIVDMAADKSGPWKVKWRLKPENNYLLEEKVNLTAETEFGDFMEYLVDRVVNMTGIRLGVTVFSMSRIIVISDSYGY